MKANYATVVFMIFFLISCNSEPSLQRYFVENTENKNFVALDVSPNILKVDPTKLSLAQNDALKAFDKINVLAFKVNDSNKAQFEIERAKVELILKDKKYQQLMKFGSGNENTTVNFVGTDEHIEEFIIYANKKEDGFAVVRILGKDMNPTSVMTLLTVLQQSNIDLEQLKPLQQLMK